MNKKPLKRSIIIGSIIFMAVLCLLLGLTTYRGYERSLYGRYEAYITDMLTYVGSSIDVDDLKECVDSGTKSPKYLELQSFLDHIKDTHKIDFLYVVIPLHTGEHDNMMNVIAAMAEYEYADLEEYSMVVPGGLTGDSYPAETAVKYYNAKDAGKIVFFEEVAEWGDDYTGILPLHTSDGAFFAELCVDVPVADIHETIGYHMIISLFLIIVTGFVFMLAFIFWSTRVIVTPIKKLEKSVAGFVSGDRSQTLAMEDPEIHTNNELESLSTAVMQMADDINDYVKEVVEAERVASEMRELANRDALTGIRNKGAFAAAIQGIQERIDQKEALPFAICVFDCDDLKSVNDLYGHDKGDEYLKAASKLICRVFSHSPVFRIGGDEFAAVLTGEDFAHREQLEKQFADESRKIRADAENEWEQVRVTNGIAVFDPHIDRTVSDAVRRADQIMYEKKRTGKEHRIEADPEEKYWDERYIVDSFKTALEQHWFKVYYQPIVRVKSRKMTALEALARWVDPVRGMIPPGEFIPVLSRLHRLYMLDLYMLEEVCREFGVRKEAGLPLLPATVNISAQDFDYVDIPENLKEITEKYGVSSDSIIVEITEQDIAEGTEQFKDALKKIRAYGFRLWIDDFGSGYSSLNVLSQYNVDRIKFDMALVQHLEDNNGANRKIMEAMVGVCREMGVGTLAEGVETEEQLAFLEEIDCDLGQGYYFFKPDPVDVSVYKFRNRKEDIPCESDEERKQKGAANVQIHCIRCGNAEPL